MSADKTREWATSTQHGFAEMSRARYEDAAQSWLRAAHLLRVEDGSDPLLAASLSNAGSAYLILNKQHDAERVFHEAERVWSRVLSKISTLDVPMTGASSSFHFRLAAKSSDALIEASRRRYQRLTEAALAITHFNHLFVDEQNVASGVVARRARELKATLCDVIGEGSVEVRLLLASSGADACSAYADEFSEFAARQRPLSTAFSEECAKLETAVALAALMGPEVFAAIKIVKTKPAMDFDAARA